MRRWSVGNWSRMGDVLLSSQYVQHLIALPNTMRGGWLFASQDPTWGVLDSQAKVLRRQDSNLANLRGSRDQLSLSADGQQIRFAYLDDGKAPARFELGRRAISGDEAGFGHPITHIFFSFKNNDLAMHSCVAWPRPDTCQLLRRCSAFIKVGRDRPKFGKNAHFLSRSERILPGTEFAQKMCVMGWALVLH